MFKQPKWQQLAHGAATLWIGWAAASCAATPTDEVETLGVVKQPLCDGSDRVRLRLSLLPFGGSSLLEGVVAHEHGYHPLVIDGNCQYWVNADWLGGTVKQPEDRPWHTGQLDAELEHTLDDALDLVRLEAMESQCARPSNSGQRGARIELFSEYSSVSCETGWGGFAPIWEKLIAQGPELYDRGSALDGPVRLAAADEFHFPDIDSEYVLWTPATPLTNYTVPLEVALKPWTSFKVDEPTEVRLLKKMREDYFVGIDALDWFWGGIPVLAGETWATVYMRDALPYEDEHGKLPF